MREVSGLSRRIEPFRALIYNRKIVRDPALVVAPPYDLIGAARQNQLYDRSPYNVVRLEFGRDTARPNERSHSGWSERSSSGLPALLSITIGRPSTSRAGCCIARDLSRV